MDNNLRIKKADYSDDIKTVETLAKEIWTQHYTSVIGENQIAYMLDKFQSQRAIKKDIVGGNIYYIAYLGNIPCGYSAVRLDANGLFLSKLYVKQSHRKMGVAKALLIKMICYGQNNNATLIWLKCNKHNSASLAAYQRLGFNITRACITDIGGGFVMDDYVLEKALG